MKKILKIFISLIFALILSASMLPLLFKDTLILELKERLNQNIEASLDFRDLNISFWNSMPKLQLNIKGLSIVGIDEFEGKPLFKADEIILETDIKSLIYPKKGISIHKFEVQNGDLDLSIAEDSTTNYDIYKSNENTRGPGLFGEIYSYAFNNCNISYIDSTSLTYFSLDSLDHAGKGDFSKTVFDLATKSTSNVSFKYGDMILLENARLTSDMTVELDFDQQRYSIKENYIRLNDLTLRANADISITEDKYNLGIDIGTPDNDIKSLLSLIPFLNNKELKEARSDGNFSLTCSIAGFYQADTGNYPELRTAVLIKDASIKYPHLINSIDRINTEMYISASQGDWDDLSLDAPSFNFKIKENALESSFRVNNIPANREYAAKLSGDMDLKKIKEAFPIRTFDTLAGSLQLNVEMNATEEAIINSKYERIIFKGDLLSEDVQLSTKNVVFEIDKIQADLKKNTLNINIDNATHKGSQLSAKLNILEPLSLLIDERLPSIEIKASSKTLMLDELRSLTSENSVDRSSTLKKEYPIPRFDQIKMDYQVEQISYQKNTIASLVLRSNINADKAEFSTNSFKFNEDAFQMNALMYEPMEYLFADGDLKADIKVSADRIDLSDLISEEDTSKEANSLELEENTDVNIQFDVLDLIYNKLTFKNVKGDIELNEKMVNLTETKAELLKGTLALEGSLDTSIKDNARFNFKYDLKDIRFSSLFASSEMFAKLSPLSEYLDGLFNTSMIITAPLNQEFKPLYDQISASGFMETIGTKLNGLPIANDLLDSLGIKGIKDWYIDDGKTWFEIKDGSVELKERRFVLDDINYKFGGSYNLDHNLNMELYSTIPRNKLKRTALGSALEKAVSKIEDQARINGMDIRLGDSLVFDIKILGTIKKPKFKIRPVGVKHAGSESVIENIGESIKDTISSKINEKKKELIDTVGSEVIKAKDKVLQETEKKIDTMISSVLDKNKQKIDSSLSRMVSDSNSVIPDKIKDILNKDTKSEIDSIKSRIKEWNPFKKKKKEGSN